MINHHKPIDKLMDCQHVKRWNLVCTAAESNVASHSFNVAVLAMAIRRQMRVRTGASEADICYYALMHDVDEAETGDMPTPTKTALRNAGVDPNSLYPTQGSISAPDAATQSIIKIADLLENYLFISQHGVGTRAAAAVSEVRGRLDAALDGASADLAAAARWVWHYVENRISDEPEERERLKEESERRIRIASASLRAVLD